jgi:hypothetical protein
MSVDFPSLGYVGIIVCGIWYWYLGRRWAQHPDPTPDGVTPGLVPGGTVVRFYGCPSGLLLFEELLPPDAPNGLPDRETMERLLGQDDHGHIGAYDGDTGERRSRETFQAVP